MALRPAKCYRKIERAWTRISKKKPKKSYVKGVPAKKIVKFETGDPKRKYDVRGFLISQKAVQIRHNALEAARVAANRYLDKSVGKDSYFLKVLVYPHHVLRENAIATGAGADRFQTGMRKAFGKPIGTAAQVKPNQRLMEVRVEKAKEQEIKEALKRASAKFPTTCKIIIEDVPN